MVEQLTQRSALVRSSSDALLSDLRIRGFFHILRLRAVYRIESLVQEQTDCPACVHPWRAVLV